MLPTDYVHVVFTLPEQLGPLALQNQRLLYGTLFRAAAESLLQLARDPQHLGADIGFLAVLHTWGQNLQLHPHVHCVVPAGGIATDGSHWVSCRPGFFLPVRVLSRLFRGKFLSLVAGAFQKGQLGFHGRQEHLADPAAFQGLLDTLWQTEWVVYAKPPFGGPDSVLKYLARYTHRVAISNHRLRMMEDGKVHFQWKDYAHGNAEKVMALDAVEFIRRFLMHVVPSGFVRIRHYGFLANRHRDEKLALCRRLLQAVPGPQIEPTETGRRHEQKTDKPMSASSCPVCLEGTMIVIGGVGPGTEAAGTRPARAEPSGADTS